MNRGKDGTSAPLRGCERTPDAVTGGTGRLGQPDRLRHIDGLRGLAMLMVLLCHGWLAFHYTAYFRTPFGRVDLFHLQVMGFLGVSLFLVLSGFCLYYPYALRRDKPGPTLESFYQRRVRRIFPPYYGIFTIGVIAAGFGILPQIYPHTYSAHELIGIILWHLLLIHNIRPEFIGTINDTMWSMGLEWQLYLFFPLLFVALRRFDPRLIISIIFVCNFVVRTYLQHNGEFEELDVYCLLLSAFGMVYNFAIGMFAAWYLTRPAPAENTERYWRWFEPAAITAALLVAAINILSVLPKIPDFTILMPFSTNAAWSTLFAALIVVASRPGRLHALLAHPWIAALGVFSYSAYLVQGSILWPICHVAGRFVRGNPAEIAVEFLVIIPLILGISYLFHCAFERPFMTIPAGELPAPKTPDRSTLIVRMLSVAMLFWIIMILVDRAVTGSM